MRTKSNRRKRRPSRTVCRAASWVWMWVTAALGWRSPMNWGLPRNPCSRWCARTGARTFGSLARLVRKYGCAQVVVGNPLYMSGDVSPQALKAQAVAQDLQLETGATITLWDERLSTTEAHRHLDAAGRQPGNRRAVIDQVAAVLILQSFLDSRR